MEPLKKTFFNWAIIFLLVSAVWSVLPIFAQEIEEEGPLATYKWFYCPRAYPFDTIPGGAFENAVIQRDALRQSSGFQFPGSAWQEIGPKPFGYDIGSSGRIHHVLYDPVDPGENGNGCVYVTGASGGLWKTRDGGVTWENKSGNLPSLSAGAFTITYVNNNKILYFGNSDGTFFFGEGRSMRLFKSTDDGTTWTSISNGLTPGTEIYKIAVSPNDPTGNTIFAATYHGLYQTTDGGGLWTRKIPEDQTIHLICSDVCFSPNGSKVYAVGPSEGRGWPWGFFDGIGYWRSDDGGNKFNLIPQTSGYPHTSNILCEKVLCAVSKASGAENLVWFITFDNLDANVDVYKSINGGQNFNSRVVSSNPNTRYQLVLRASDVDANICFAGSESLYRTLNGGNNSSDWTCMGGYCGGTLSHPDFLALDFNPSYPTKITVGEDGGVFRSDDLGNGWVSCNQNLGSFSLLHGLTASTYDGNFMVCGLHDFGYGYNPTTGPSSTYWYSTSYGGDGGVLTASPFKSNRFVGNKLYGSIEYSTNGIDFQGALGYSLGAVAHPPFTQHPTEPGVVYTVRFEDEANNQQHIHFLKSTDYGANWGENNAPWREFNRPNGWNATAPHLIAISQSNPNTIVMGFGNTNEFWLNTFDARSRLIKSTNGGLNWFNEQNGQPIEEIVYGGQLNRGLPNRSITDVEFDPLNENELYLTVSGYYPIFAANEGHVFKSTDGGYNWSNISANLPDIPVNDLIIHYKGSGISDKELIIATDAGIYSYNALNNSWNEIAQGFPNTPALHLDYNRLSGKLRANTWWRGGWEFQLDNNTIYVQDKLYITDNVSIDKDIVVCPGGKLMLGYANFPAINISFAQGKKITVLDGGQLDASSGSAITFTSPGQWGGIEFQGSGNGTLNNCAFINTNTPISASSIGVYTANSIYINQCTFYDGYVEINSRPHVTMQGCNWSYSGSYEPAVSGLLAVNSDNTIIQESHIISSSPINSYGISIVYGNDISIANNEILNMGVGMRISNSSPYIRDNTISLNGLGLAGIELDNSHAAVINDNTITGYYEGFHIGYSSPTMLRNSTTTAEGTYAIVTEYYSNPRLRPIDEGDELIIDAGYNILRTNNTGMLINGYSFPDIDYGCNTIYGTNVYNVDAIFDMGIQYNYMARNNDWVDDPIPEKFNIVGGIITYEPYGCPIGGSGGDKASSVIEGENSDIYNPEPPQPLIVNRGNGFYDTLQVRNANLQLSPDQVLFEKAMKQELLSNYSNAIDIYKQFIQENRNSKPAIEALKRIMLCYDKSSPASDAYTSLRNYYEGLIKTKQNDELFIKAVKELAIKTLVRMKEYPDAITQYENLISQSSNSQEVLYMELNIIETYMLILDDGKDQTFVGKIPDLKPTSLMDGVKMIREKMHGKNGIKSNNVIPNVFSLSQNYPNPFNPLTKINYSLPLGTKVSIKVFDLLGRLVNEIVNEYKDAGNYTVTFDGTNLASGVYFYKIEAGKFNDTKKMVLVK